MTATLAPRDEAADWYGATVDLDELLGSPAGLSGRELGDRLVELDRLRRALEAATVAVLDEAERSDGYRDDGCITLGSWARLVRSCGRKHEATTRARGSSTWSGGARKLPPRWRRGRWAPCRWPSWHGHVLLAGR